MASNGDVKVPNPDTRVMEVNPNYRETPRTVSTFDSDRVMDFLRDWFDPMPQIEEMASLSFWKDMVVEGFALGYILFAAILVLNSNSEKAVSCFYFCDFIVHAKKINYTR